MIKVEKAKNKINIWNVFLDNKRVGEIRYLINEMKYQYFPKGAKEGGQKCERLAAAILSLEN